MSDTFERAVREALIASWDHGYTACSLGQFDVTFPVAHDEAARVSSKLRAALLAEIVCGVGGCGDNVAPCGEPLEPHCLPRSGYVRPDEPATAKEPI